MITLTHVGTGEAIDPNRVNTSYLIEHNDKMLLVDCGYDVYKSVMRLLEKRKRMLDDVPHGVLLTHGHGDHMGSIGALLLGMWEESNGVVGTSKKGIEREVEIFSANPELFPFIETRMQNDYPGFFARFGKEGPRISYTEVKPGSNIYGMRIDCAVTQHSVKNFAYRFKTETADFAISGDGALTDASRKLFEKVPLLIHEGFTIIDDPGKNHASVKQVLDYANDAQIPNVRIVHVNREQRGKENEINEMRKYARARNIELSFPVDHEVLEL